MFFSYKKRTKRILNISKGRAPGVVPSPVLFAASGDAAPCSDPKNAKIQNILANFLSV